jgi:hypothetical protein
MIIIIINVKNVMIYIVNIVFNYNIAINVKNNIVIIKNVIILMILIINNVRHVNYIYM